MTGLLPAILLALALCLPAAAQRGGYSGSFYPGSKTDDDAPRETIRRRPAKKKRKEKKVPAAEAPEAAQKRRKKKPEKETAARRFSSKREAGEHFTKGAAEYRLGNFQEALQSLDQALDSRPSIEAYSIRARVRGVLGDRDGMADDMDRVLKGRRERGAEGLTARGNAMILAGEPDRAVREFEAALEADPDHADAHVGMGRALSASGMTDPAIDAFRRGIKIDGNHLVARYNLAKAYFETGQKDKAKAELTRALNANRKFALAYGLLGVIFADDGDTKRAVAAYSKAIRLLPSYAYAHIGRALVYHKLRKDQLSANDFREAVRIDPGNYAGYYNRGEVFYRSGDKDAALSDFRLTLKLPVPNQRAAITIGDRFAEAKLHDEAVRTYTKGLEAAGRIPDAAERAVRTGETLLARAHSLTELRALSKALEDLDAAVKIDPASPVLWTARGKLYLKMDRPGRAIDDFSKAVSVDPKHAPAFVARGEMLVGMERFEDALKDFTSAIESDPNLPDAYNSRGKLWMITTADFDKAVRDFVKAISLDSANGVYRLNLGRARLRQERFWDAVDSLDKALLLKAPADLVLRERAEAHYALGNLGQAHQDIEEGLKANPKSSPLYASLGSFRLRSRSAPQAVRDLDHAISLNKNNASAFLFRGFAYGAIGNYRRAMSDFSAAVKRTKIPVEALTGLCHARRLYGRHKQAVSACAKAIQLDPEYAPALVHRGLAYLALDDYSRAARDLGAADGIGPKRPQVLLAYSAAHAALRQYKQSDRAYREAMAMDFQVKTIDITMGEDPGPKWDYTARIKDLEKQLDHDGDDPYTYLVRGNALHNAGHYDRAVLEYTRAMEFDGKMTAAYLARGAALAAQESLDAAEQDLRRAVSLDPSDPLTTLGLVTLLTARGKFSTGLKSAIQALRDQGEAPSPEMFVKAGNLRYFMRKVQLAAENYKYAIKFSKTHAAAYNGLGLTLFAERKYQEAIENFSKAIRLHPDYDRYYRNRASAYVNLGLFANAAADYKLALAVNLDPEMVDEYRRLIKNSLARSPGKAPVQESSAAQ